MFLTDHHNNVWHYGEEKNEMITAVTAFFFNTGIIYHIGYTNGNVEVMSNVEGQSIYFDHEVFPLPEVRLETISVDFSNVVITDEGYSGVVNVGGKSYPLPYRRRDPEYLDDYGFNRHVFAEQFANGALFVPEGELTAPPGEPTTVTVNTPDPETRVYEGAPFTRVSFVVNDDFTVRAVPEERNE